MEDEANGHEEAAKIYLIKFYLSMKFIYGAT